MSRMKKSCVITDMLGIAVEPTYFDLQHCDPNPAQIIKIIKDIGANTIRIGMFSHQGHTYYPSKIAPQAPFLKKNLLAEFSQQCKKEGLRLAVYLNSKWVTDLYKKHPDWAITFGQGPMSINDVIAETLDNPVKCEQLGLKLYPMCPNSPFMNAYFLKIVKEITAYNPDAIYIDNFAIQPFCSCAYCKDKYPGSIPQRKTKPRPEIDKYYEWVVEESRQMAKDIVAAARIKDSQLPVIFNRGNFWNVTGAFSPEDNYKYAHEIADMIHTESAVRFYDELFEHIDEQCTFGRAIDLPVWTWVEYPLMPYSYIAAPAAETLIKAAKVVANGARPMVWSMPFAPEIAKKETKGIKQVFELVSENKEYFNNVKSDKCLGIVYSSASLKAYTRIHPGQMKKYKKIFGGALHLAMRNHLPYDFVLDSQITEKNLSQYSLIVLPNVIYLNQDQCEQIRKYVNNGGSLLATYETSLYNHDVIKTDFALSDVFGASYNCKVEDPALLHASRYCRFVTNHPIVENGNMDNIFPVSMEHLVVESDRSIAMFLEFCRYYCDHLQKQTTMPAIVANEYGKGRVVYIASEFFRLYYENGFEAYDKFFRKCMGWFTKGKLPIVTDLPDTVAININNTADGHKVIHLVNCSFDKTRPIQQIIPATEKNLAILTDRKSADVIDITTGKKVQNKIEDKYLKINLPQLTGYSVIVVK